MDEDKQTPAIKDVSYADYGFFLSIIYSWLFPPLLEKSLNFYIWFFMEKEPTTIFTTENLVYVLSVLDREKPADIDSLATLVQRQTIPDGIAVREAIRRRLNHLGGRTDKRLLAPNDACGAVRECLLSMVDAMRRSEERKAAKKSTKGKPQ